MGTFGVAVLDGQENMRVEMVLRCGGVDRPEPRTQVAPLSMTLQRCEVALTVLYFDFV